MLRASAGAVVVAGVGCWIGAARAQTADDQAQAPDTVAPALAFDAVYLIRQQSAIGVKAPRRPVYVGVRKFF